MKHFFQKMITTTAILAISAGLLSIPAHAVDNSTLKLATLGAACASGATVGYYFGGIMRYSNKAWVGTDAAVGAAAACVVETAMVYGAIKVIETQYDAPEQAELNEPAHTESEAQPE